jgi:Arc/MetJ family transcription regulator
MDRFTISIDSELLSEAMRLSGKKRKREVIELALCELIKKHRLAELQDLAGSGLVDWTLEDFTSWREAAKEEENE